MFNKNLWLDKKLPLWVPAAIVIIFLLVLAFRHKSENPIQQTNKPQTVIISPSGMKYPKGWSELTQISADDKNAGVVSEAVHTLPDSQTIIKVDNESLAKDFDINKSLTETVTKLQANLTNFDLVNKAISNIGKTPSLLITYKDSQGSITYQHLQIIVPTANKIYFVTISSQASEFSKIDKDISQIKSALATYTSRP